MTPEQRETLEKLALRYVNGPHAILTHAEYTALRAALAPAPTCGTCKHLWKQAEGYGFCDAPEGLAGVPFPHYLMPLGERCTGWTPKEGA